MKLLLDVGNTALKWSLVEAARLGAGGRFEHRNAAFSELAAAAWSGLPVPEAVVVANVAGNGMAEDITRFVQQAWQLEPRFVSTECTARGVTNAYHRPDDLGVDRWVAMIAAHHMYDGPLCIIDCGTAITVDLLAADGQHQGGLILPGVGLLCQSLEVNTAGIQLQDKALSASLLSRGTRAGVIGGAQYLVAAAIDRIVSDMHKTSSEPVTAIVTGGDAQRLLGLLSEPVQHVPGLVLQGLAILSEGEG